MGEWWWVGRVMWFGRCVGGWVGWVIAVLAAVWRVCGVGMGLGRGGVMTSLRCKCDV